MHEISHPKGVLSLEFKNFDPEFSSGEKEKLEITIKVRKEDSHKWDIFSKISSETETLIHISPSNMTRNGLVVLIYGKTRSMFKTAILGSFIIPCDPIKIKEAVHGSKIVNVVVKDWADRSMIFVAKPKKHS